jgi:outer membrane lipoprotein SlyB
MKTIALALAAVGMTATTAVVPLSPAVAKERRYYSTDNGVRYWQGNDGRYYCKRSNGTTGLLIGGAAGALIGRAVDTRGSRATGTIVGAVAGALVGREIQRSRSTARCR